MTYCDYGRMVDEAVVNIMRCRQGGGEHAPVPELALEQTLKSILHARIRKLAKLAKGTQQPLSS